MHTVMVDGQIIVSGLASLGTGTEMMYHIVKTGRIRDSERVLVPLN